jgi:TPR repeat protein
MPPTCRILARYKSQDCQPPAAMKHRHFHPLVFLLAAVLLSFPNARAAEALGELNAAAENGSAEAQYKLGLAYQKGDGVGKDPAEALKWLEKSAAHGWADAQHVLGFMHAHGAGVPQNLAEGLIWYRKAAEQNHPAAQLYMGIECLEGAEENRDFSAAMKWFLKAADQNLAEAQFYVGMLHMIGAGVPIDTPTAVKWLTKAAEQGDVRSQCRLGVLYSTGQGIPKDVELGAMYLNLAATGLQRFPEGEEARDALTELEASLTPDQAAAARTKAAHWARSAADAGKPDAQYAASVMYANERGMPKDPVLAHLYMALALKSGRIPEAQFGLDDLEKTMSPRQLEAARGLEGNWKPSEPAK